jgi:hypothetical protein
MIDTLISFAKAVAVGEVDVYNEFSLQHELGFLLRNRLHPETVQFERRVDFFGFSRKNFIKKEIDIAVFSPDRSILRYAIELKYPRNGQYPEQMYNFCRDIVFIEQLRQAGFQRTFLVIFADDPRFYLVRARRPTVTSGKNALFTEWYASQQEKRIRRSSSRGDMRSGGTRSWAG